MKAVESPLLPGAQGPGFAAIQKGAHHTSLVHLYFCVFCELTVCPDFFCCQSGECDSCFSNASVELGLKGEAFSNLVFKTLDLKGLMIPACPSFMCCCTQGQCQEQGFLRNSFVYLLLGIHVCMYCQD